MGERKTKEMEGVNLSGERRKYTFQLMDGLTGLIVFHEYGSACMRAAHLLKTALPMIHKYEQKLLKAAEEGKETVELGLSDLGPEGLQLLEFIPEVVTPLRLQMLCKQMLVGCVVEFDDGTKETVGETGVGEYTEGNPLEVYVALYYAIKANYPKVIAPLSELASMVTGMLADMTLDSSQDDQKENESEEG